MAKFQNAGDGKYVGELSWELMGRGNGPRNNERGGTLGHVINTNPALRIHCMVHLDSFNTSTLLLLPTHHILLLLRGPMLQIKCRKADYYVWITEGTWNSFDHYIYERQYQ